jgi:hypothetical protein
MADLAMDIAIYTSAKINGLGHPSLPTTKDTHMLCKVAAVA